MKLDDILKQKNLNIKDVTKDECFRFGQASVMCWLAELLHVSTFNASERAIEKLFEQEEL